MLHDVPALDAKSTQGIRFRNNSIVRSGPEAWDVVLRSCTDVDIDEPTLRVTELG